MQGYDKGEIDVAHGRTNHNLHLIGNDGIQQEARPEQEALVSSVFRIEGADLPAFFSYHDERFSRNRFFWSEPGRDLSFVGLGSVMTIEAGDRNDRFREVEQRWMQILERAHVDEDIPEYTGPIMFGGFAFNPSSPSSPVWRHFPHTRFVVPEIMLTSRRGETWVTVNKLSSASGEDELEARLDTILREHRAASHEESVHPGTIYKEEISPQDWMRTVEQAAASIRAGELDKVVLARPIRLFAERPFCIRDILNRLLQEQTNTYVFAIEYEGDCFVGATPERLVRSKGREFHTLSLAGSIARGRTPSEDKELGQTLFHDEKNILEHALAVQMIKEAMDELCHTVNMPDEPILYKLKDIQHLLTPITGQAKEGVSLLTAVASLHPTPALGGMPKEAAIEAIRKLENMDRGWYAAPIGWIDRKLDGEFAAAIRSALIQGKEASLFAGCGIVGDSDPLSEYQETALKFRPMLSALQGLDSQIVETSDS